jgi:hypothetical protein
LLQPTAGTDPHSFSEFHRQHQHGHGRTPDD